ncbi:MAG: rod shape-determining protein MreC [Bacteroidales bacterium]
MRRLISYLLRHHFLVLFLALETTAFLMLSGNPYHHSRLSGFAIAVTGGIDQTVSDIADYFSLKRQNEILLNENSRLREKIVWQNDWLTAEDSARLSDTVYRFVPARVVRNTTGKQNNYIVLDKGSDKGIKIEAGVISPKGVIGTVVAVSPKYSLAMSVLHSRHKISALVAKNKHLGTVEWDGSDYRRGVLTGIPLHVNLEPGDTIVTSGYSSIFPPGTLIGTVDKGNQDVKGNFRRIPVRFAVDFNNISSAYIVLNRHRAEIDSLLLKDEELQ